MCEYSRRVCKNTWSLKDIIFLLDNYLDFIELCSLALTCKSIMHFMLEKNSCLCHCEFFDPYERFSPKNVKAIKNHLNDKKDLRSMSLISSCIHHPTRIVHLKLGAWWYYLNEMNRFFLSYAIVKSHVLTLSIDTSFYTSPLFFDKKEEMKKQGNTLTTLPMLQLKDKYHNECNIVYDEVIRMPFSKRKEDCYESAFKDQNENHVILLTQTIYKIFTFQFLQSVEEIKINGIALSIKDTINRIRSTKSPLYYRKLISLLRKYPSFWSFSNEENQRVPFQYQNLHSSLIQKYLVLQRIAIALRILSLCSDSVEKVWFMPLPVSFSVNLHSNELSFIQLFHTNTLCENIHFPKLQSIIFPSTLNSVYILPLLNSSFFSSLHQVSLLGFNIHCGSLFQKITCYDDKQLNYTESKFYGKYQWGIYPAQENTFAVYYGSVDHLSRFHGLGIYVCKTYTYEGCFREGFNDGYGILNTTYGEEYQGFWKKGYRHGYGISRQLNGTIYEGNWKHDVLHGRGFMKDFHTLGYDGEWFNGLFHGWGVLFLRNQIIAIGQFYAGKPFGEFRCRQNLLYAFLKSQDTHNTKIIAYQDIHSPTDYFKILKTIGLSKDYLLQETISCSKNLLHPTVSKAFSLNDHFTFLRKPCNFFTKSFCFTDACSTHHSITFFKMASLSLKTLKEKFKTTACVKKHEKNTHVCQSFHSNKWTRIYINSNVNHNVLNYDMRYSQLENILLLDADRCHQNYFNCNFPRTKTSIPHWIQHLVNTLLIP